jgi:hypothetical protein
MSRKIALKFKVNDEEWEVIRSFCVQLGMAPETFARQATFLCIQQSMARAQEAQEKALAYLATQKQETPDEQPHDSTSSVTTEPTSGEEIKHVHTYDPTSRDTPADTTEASTSTDAGSTTLADTQTDVSTSPAE